ncbi:MAG: DNA-binding protein [Desulfobacterales bacterium]|nr:DNA-binding protein [Desulfobacterales bacterium]
MQYSEAKQGRIFVIRLEHGEVIHETIEKFATQHQISSAALIIVGAADKESQLIVGPKDADAKPVIPVSLMMERVHEICGTGTLFLDDHGKPMLHMHIACGSQDKTLVGCIRNGVKVWQVLEVILYEILDSTARRLPDPNTGFKLLCP